MACSLFAPPLPHESVEEQELWLNRWKTNLLNSACIQDMCATLCLPGHSPLDASCLSCLQQQNCSGTYNCLDCIGKNPKNLDNFQIVYDCSINKVQPGTIAGIMIGCIFGVLLIIALVSFILFKTGKYPKGWRDRLDNEYFTEREEFKTSKPIVH
jgi:hypothetical protein